MGGGGRCSGDGVSVGGYSAEIERFRAVTSANPQNYGSNVLVKQITTNRGGSQKTCPRT